jgi:uncharacterized membrane protein YgaE (UPF0421/DUF939 family)
VELLKNKDVTRLIKSAEPIGLTKLQVLEHSSRTAITAILSMVAAELVHLPQSYWAPITTIVITQSSLGSALSVSGERFLGTALGAVVGAAFATYFGPHLFVFGISVFVMGLCCAVFQANRSAYRFGGVTVGIVLLLPRTEPAWRFALHRFAEVSIGIAVALIMTLIWPERPPRNRADEGLQDVVPS